MRTIPVTVNSNHEKVVGWLHLDDTISDEEVVNASISWAIDRRDKKLLEITLIPNPGIPKDLIQNVPGLEGYSEFRKPPGQHPLHDVVEDAEMEFNMKQLGIDP